MVNLYDKITESKESELNLLLWCSDISKFIDVCHSINHMDRHITVNIKLTEVIYINETPYSVNIYNGNDIRIRNTNNISCDINNNEQLLEFLKVIHERSIKSIWINNLDDVILNMENIY